MISPGNPAFVLADISVVKALFGVPDLEVQNLKIGSTLVGRARRIARERVHGSNHFHLALGGSEDAAVRGRGVDTEPGSSAQGRDDRVAYAGGGS